MGGLKTAARCALPSPRQRTAEGSCSRRSSTNSRCSEREKLSTRGVAAVVGGVGGSIPAALPAVSSSSSSGVVERSPSKGRKQQGGANTPYLYRTEDKGSRTGNPRLPRLTASSNVIACDNKRKMPAREGGRKRRVCLAMKEKEVEGSPVLRGSLICGIVDLDPKNPSSYLPSPRECPTRSLEHETERSCVRNSNVR